MPQTKFIVSKIFHGTKENEVLVTRETDNFFWTLEPDGSERKRSKDSSLRLLIADRKEAQYAVILREEAQVAKCKRDLERAVGDLDQAINRLRDSSDTRTSSLPPG